MWQGIDQRQFPRVKVKCVVKLRQEQAEAVISSETENVGLGGVCVLLQEGLDIFSPVSVELILEDGKPPIQVQGTIVWVVRRRGMVKGPVYDTGIEFAELAAQDKARLEAVMDKVRP